MKPKLDLLLSSFFSILCGVFCISEASALDLDWKGQFRVESVWIPNYTMGKSGLGGDTARFDAQNDPTGYYVAPGGQRSAKFQTLFMRLNPSVIVNDNVTIHSEVWFGNPSTGFYGNGLSTGTNSGSTQQYFNSSFSGGSTVTAQRFWADIQSNFGLFQVGRAPLHWGLGAVYNEGAKLYDRFQSTGDVFRLNAKFGNFSLIPSTVKYLSGAVVGGGGTLNSTTGLATNGAGGMSDYNLALRYDNADELFEGGVQFTRRLAGPDASAVWLNGYSGGLGITLWDIYVKKTVGKFDFALEAPIAGGKINGVSYSSYAIIGEAKYHSNPNWTWGLMAGKVPGQKNDALASEGTVNPSGWNMFYLNPNYKLGHILFNYNLRAMGRVNRTVTTSGTTSQVQRDNIYDNPITNANYASLSAAYTRGKWVWTWKLITATADQTADAGQSYFNTWNRSYSTNAAGGKQGSKIGTEGDFSLDFNWDEYTQMGLDLGYLATGDYFAFSGTATPNQHKGVWLGAFRVGVAF